MAAKLTLSQQKVLDLLQQVEKLQPISAQGIYLELCNRHKALGIATIYRALEALKVKGKKRQQTPA